MFEYKLIEINLNNLNDIDKETEYLRDAGYDDWELVSVLENSYYRKYYFKRKV